MAQNAPHPAIFWVLNGYEEAFFLLDAAWVRSRAERPSVSYTKVTSKVAWTSHMNMKKPRSIANSMSSTVNSANWSAKDTRLASRSLRFRRPRRFCASLNGLGVGAPCLIKCWGIGRSRARLPVPHGNAT